VVASVGRALVSLTALRLRLGLLPKGPILLWKGTVELEERLQGTSLGRTSMEPPADPFPPSPTELELLEKEQPLGEATNLGCPRFETPNAVATAVSSGPTKIPGKTAIPEGSRAATIPTAIPGGSQTTTTPTAIPRGPATAAPTAIPGGSDAALTAATPGSAETIQT